MIAAGLLLPGDLRSDQGTPIGFALALFLSGRNREEDDRKNDGPGRV